MFFSDLKDNLEKSCMKQAARAQAECLKVKRIEDQDQVVEAEGCKEEIQRFRAQAVSNGYKQTAKICDGTVAHINKLLKAYKKAAQS